MKRAMQSKKWCVIPRDKTSWRTDCRNLSGAHLRFCAGVGDMF